MELNDSPSIPNWSRLSTGTRAEKFPSCTACVARDRSEIVRVMARVNWMPMISAASSISRNTTPMSSSSNAFAALSSPSDAKIR
jgi:hypothetical protein